ncbi:hypothetical protein N9N67_09570 [Bacteriovoracaceae bacterium]|nr:hypothetical protein [Bacteriovoracaceae bacterium]
MVNIRFFFSVLTLIVFMSCQEQVSDDLPSKRDSTDEASTNVDTSGTPSIYTFKLEHDMDEDLSFLLHQTGLGNMDTPCEINSTSVFSAQSPQTIDCYLDGEELDIYANGAQLTMTGSVGACEYLGYVPYGYYKYPIGKTLKYKFEHECDDACLTGMAVGEECPSSSYEPICDYDHSINNDGAPNCDLGKIITVTLRYEGAGCDVVGGADTSATPTSIDIGSFTSSDCGGSTWECMAGPVKDQLDEDTPYEFVPNPDMEEISFSMDSEAPEVNRETYNINVANYIGMCNDSSATNDASYWLEDGGLSFDDNANPFRNLTTYDTSRMEGYMFTSTNDNGDVTLLDDAQVLYTIQTIDADTGGGENTVNVGAYDIDLDNVRDDLITSNNEHGAYFDTSGDFFIGDSGNGGTILDSVPITTDPFRARFTSGDKSYYPYPFYYYLCLDKSFDIKAQITLIIRDWDLEFDHSYEYIEYLTDHFETDSLMDRHPKNATTSETVGIPGLSDWNDQTDWDDFLYNNGTGTALIENDCDSFTNQIDTSTPAANSAFPHENNFPGCNGMGAGCF